MYVIQVIGSIRWQSNCLVLCFSTILLSLICDNFCLYLSFFQPRVFFISKVLQPKLDKLKRVQRLLSSIFCVKAHFFLSDPQKVFKMKFSNKKSQFAQHFAVFVSCRFAFFRKKTSCVE